MRRLEMERRLRPRSLSLMVCNVAGEAKERVDSRARIGTQGELCGQIDATIEGIGLRGFVVACRGADVVGQYTSWKTKRRGAVDWSGGK